VDIKRKRIGLSMRKDGDGGIKAPQRESRPARDDRPRGGRGTDARSTASQGAFASAFADALRRK
jgi:uncharacterized protein